MEENKIGQFIRDRRLQLEMTQQQLADKLDVTDKAVSKWERSVSYPDITILRELAAALEVSVSELLAGEKEETPPVSPAVENVVVDAVAYAETARQKSSRWRWWTFVALTACCAIGALVCFIFYCINRRFWTVAALRSIAFGWAVCYPLLRSERYPVRNAMAIASVAVYPFIWCMGAHRACHLGIVVVSVAYAWTVYLIWQKCTDKPKAIAPALVLGGLLHVSINLLVELYDFAYTKIFIVAAAALALDGLCLGVVWALERFPARRG